MRVAIGSMSAGNWFCNLSLLGLGAFFCVNALFLQSGQHPAPLIGARYEAADTREIRLVSATDNATSVRENPLVKAVQTELQAMGLYQGPLDGMMGANTRAAIEAYELSAGLSVTGEPTPRLVSHIRLSNDATVNTASLQQSAPSLQSSEDALDAIAALIAREGIDEPSTAGLVPRPDETVKSVQYNLKQLGFDPGPVDGLMGPGTERAIRAFQSAHGLPVTGQADNDLMRRLFAIAQSNGQAGG